MERQTRKIVVIGGGYAGVLCAVRTKRNADAGAEVVLVSASDRFVERIRQHEVAAGSEARAIGLADLLAGTGVRLVQKTAIGIDAAARTVDLGDEVIGYDRLVLALGSRIDVDAVPGVRDHAFTMEPDSALRLRAALPAIAAAGGRLLVCGGGLTGIELASELAERHPGLRVTLVSRAPLGEGLLSPGARRHLRRALERLGVQRVEGVAVQGLEAGRALTSDGPITFDACAWAGGFVAPPLPRRAGFAVNERGQVLVDARLRSVSHPEVYAVGDVAAPVEAVGAPLTMACKTALPMGAHAADNLGRELVGEPEQPFRFGDSILCISLGRHDGIVQPRRPDGRNRRWALTGRLGALVKERVCRFTVWSLDRERRGHGYWWPRPPVQAALPAGAGKQLTA